MMTDSAYFRCDELAIYNADMLACDAVADSSVDLIVTSPPYNVDIDYGEYRDDRAYDAYLDFTGRWLRRCLDMVRDDGRMCVNVLLDNNKGGRYPMSADVTELAVRAGWKYHATIIWNKSNITRRTAWGSWKSAGAPYVTAPVEVILVLYKNSWKKSGGSGVSDITRDEFIQWTNGVWSFPGQGRKVTGGHPAPFPAELPRRCIRMFSFVGDTVLDPFMGSGTTLISAYQHRRTGIGIEIDRKYCDIALGRLERETHIRQHRIDLGYP